VSRIRPRGAALRLCSEACHLHHRCATTYTADGLNIDRVDFVCVDHVIRSVTPCGCSGITTRWGTRPPESGGWDKTESVGRGRQIERQRAHHVFVSDFASAIRNICTKAFNFTYHTDQQAYTFHGIRCTSLAPTLQAFFHSKHTPLQVSVQYTNYFDTQSNSKPQRRSKIMSCSTSRDGATYRGLSADGNSRNGALSTTLIGSPCCAMRWIKRSVRPIHSPDEARWGSRPTAT
jgi:hypothetical protein